MGKTNFRKAISVRNHIDLNSLATSCCLTKSIRGGWLIDSPGHVWIEFFLSMLVLPWHPFLRILTCWISIVN
ncbi:hypothetical protein C2S51_021931 [Perilla frutescens var. frutescens]|nr:hypothetical protein C2S51_021931 [Perilla frutescens var. frutescens]